MKKGVFTVMHYYLPKAGALSLHSSANEVTNAFAAMTSSWPIMTSSPLFSLSLYWSTFDGFGCDDVTLRHDDVINWDWGGLGSSWRCEHLLRSVWNGQNHSLCRSASQTRKREITSKKLRRKFQENSKNLWNNTKTTKEYLLLFTLSLSYPSCSDWWWRARMVGWRSV